MSVRNIKLNLLPPEFRPAPTVTIFPVLFGVAVGLGLLFVIVTFLLTESKLTGIHSKIESTKKELASLEGPVKQYDTIIAARVEIDKRKAIFNYIDKNYVYWPTFIADLVPLVPENVWLVELTSEALTDQENGGKVTIRGRTKDGKILPVAFFMQNLKASGLYSEVKIGQSQVQFISEIPVHEFSIVVQVKSRKDFTPPPPAPKESDDKGAGKPGANASGKVAAAKPGAT